MSLLKWIDQLDKFLIVLIQHDSDQPLWDRIMPILRDPYTWIPLYLFMAWYAIRKQKQRAWLFIGLSILTFAVTDSVTTQILKPLFGRLRPCCDPELHSVIRTLVDCGGIYSMPSSHAANHFGLAAFWYFSVLHISGKRWAWLWAWAAAVCYAQVYVGKHFPSDILVGGIIGYITGTGMAKLFEFGRQRLDAGRGNIFPLLFKKSPESSLP